MLSHRVSKIFCLLLYIILTNMFLSCSQKYNEIPMETFVNIYIDLTTSKEISSIDSLADSSFVAKREKYYKRYNVTEGQIKATIESYNKDIYKWKEFYQAVTNKLEAMQISNEINR